MRGALTNGRRNMRGHAACLAATRDVPGLRDEVEQFLEDVLRRPTARGSMPNEAAVAVAYLLGHGDDAVRLNVARTLWRARDRCDEDTRDWISHHWPAVLLCDAEPQTLPAVNVRDLLDWVKKPRRWQEHREAKWASTNRSPSATELSQRLVAFCFASPTHGPVDTQRGRLHVLSLRGELTLLAR